VHSIELLLASKYTFRSVHLGRSVCVQARKPQPRPLFPAVIYACIYMQMKESALLSEATALKLTLVPFKVMRFINLQKQFQLKCGHHKKEMLSAHIAPANAIQLL